MFRRCVTPRVVVPKGSVNAHQTKVTLRPAKIPTMSGKRVRFVPRRALSIVPDQCPKKIREETDMESHKDLQGPNSNEIGHSIEHFDLYSEVFGPGSSTLDVAIPALFRQTWFFPGSYNVPYYNAFTEAPIQFNPNQ